MKKIYIIPLCVILGVPALTAGNRFQHRKAPAVKTAGIEKVARAAVNRPLSQTDYIYDDGQWIEIGTVEFQYDERGNLLVQTIEEDGELSRIISEYDSNDMPVSVISYMADGDDWFPESKRTYTYDPIVTDYYTERLGFDMVDNEWVRNFYCETNEITRNAENKITGIVKSLPVTQIMFPAYRSEWKYDQEGKATEFYYYCNYNTAGEAEWELYDNQSFRDIEWDACNGQLVLDDIRNYVTGENRIKKVDVFYDDEHDGYILVSYGENGSYIVKETFADENEVAISTEFTYTDSFGSYTVIEKNYLDEDYNLTELPVSIYTETVTLDEHGNIISEELFVESEEETGLIGGNKYDYEYDADGNVASITESVYDSDSDDYLPDNRIVYGEYTDCTGIADITAEPEWYLGTGTVRASVPGMTSLSIYNMQGVKVASVPAEGNASINTAGLSSGLYILHAEGTGASVRYLKR